MKDRLNRLLKIRQGLMKEKGRILLLWVEQTKGRKVLLKLKEHKGHTLWLKSTLIVVDGS